MTTMPKLTDAQRFLLSKVSQREVGFATLPKIARIAAEKDRASAFTSAGSAVHRGGRHARRTDRPHDDRSPPEAPDGRRTGSPGSHHTVQANRIPSPARA